MKFELRQILEQDSSAVVNGSSIGGLVGGAGRYTDHAAKHGVFSLTKSSTLEHAGRDSRINAVCPGLIHTLMVDQMMASGQTEALG